MKLVTHKTCWRSHESVDFSTPLCVCVLSTEYYEGLILKGALPLRDAEIRLERPGRFVIICQDREVCLSVVIRSCRGKTRPVRYRLTCSRVGILIAFYIPNVTVSMFSVNCTTGFLFIMYIQQQCQHFMRMQHHRCRVCYWKLVFFRHQLYPRVVCRIWWLEISAARASCWSNRWCLRRTSRVNSCLRAD